MDDVAWRRPLPRYHPPWRPGGDGSPSLAHRGRVYLPAQVRVGALPAAQG